MSLQKSLVRAIANQENFDFLSSCQVMKIMPLRHLYVFKRCSNERLGSDTPLRLPKTSKLLENTASSQNLQNDREREVEKISQRLAEQFVTETETRFGKSSYYPDCYVGGYRLPSSSNRERQSCSFEQRERENECPENAIYAGRGYDVDYYGGYTGGYGENYEDAEEEEKGKPIMPRWYRETEEGVSEGMERGEGMRNPGLNTVHSSGQELEKERNPAQARLLRLKEAYEAESLKKNAAFSGTLEKENLGNPQPATSERGVKSSSSASSSVPVREYMTEIDDEGFLELLVSKGRGRGRGIITG
ncbi:uncharacterized protein LOC120354092 [Nilaparvata lugens]|uniref:uncharacterized protein LOC120354092 n=1 Tax=Nilaparvata lugens TaxID=108931 RepID=UPI00193D339A|nr:uncharacterized protein LOC120354092 [Nilaparvata lugens]